MPANRTKNDLRIANLALSKLGSFKINSFIEEGSNEAAAVDDVWDDILQEVLAEHPWAFAQKRKTLDYVVPDDVSRTINGRIYTPVAITGATKDEPCVITAADHGLADDDRIQISGVVGMTQLNGNFYRVNNATRNTFELIDEDTEEDIDSSAFTTYTSGGKIYFANDRTPLLITAATAANPVQITSAAHGLATGDWIKIHGVSGMTQLNDVFFIVAGATTNTFTLTDTDGEAIDGLLYTAYVSGGEILLAPDYPVTETGSVVVYEKPSDLVKLIKKSNSMALLNIEQDKLISNTEGLTVIYTFLNRDTKQYFAKFVQALATRLAAEIAFRLTQSVSKADGLMKLYYDAALPTAVSADSTQGSPDEVIDDEWDAARLGGSRGFATTGQTWHPI